MNVHDFILFEMMNSANHQSSDSQPSTRSSFDSYDSSYECDRGCDCDSYDCDCDCSGGDGCCDW